MKMIKAITLDTDEKESFSALVFKTIVDPFVGRINYLKVHSGTLNTDSQIYNADKQKSEKVSQVFTIKGKNQIAIGKLFTGDIGAVTKIKFNRNQ